MGYEDDKNFGSGQPTHEGWRREGGTSNQPIIIEKPRKAGFFTILGRIIFALSIMGNIVLFFAVMGMAVFFAAGQHEVYMENVVREGPRTEKIAILNIRGFIGQEQSENIYTQIKTAKKDPTVKALIVRVNSPGGMISASDQIYNAIKDYERETKRPTLAFMEGLAASGGYYTSVSCDKIIAEPTAITGSIGVIMNYLVLDKLLGEKLGVTPVVSKSGEKKDWPSPFHPPTEEQLQYLQDKLIKPSYERFVKIVADNRKALTIDEVRTLADGSIYGAQEAVDNKLIDGIGYLNDAIDEAMKMAKITEARVIEYRRPFSFQDFLRSEGSASLKIDRQTIFELTTPKALFLWDGY